MRAVSGFRLAAGAIVVLVMVHACGGDSFESESQDGSGGSAGASGGSTPRDGGPRQDASSGGSGQGGSGGPSEGGTGGPSEGGTGGSSEGGTGGSSEGGTGGASEGGTGGSEIGGTGGSGQGGSTASGGGGGVTIVDAGPPLECEYDADCTFGMRFDVCCPACPEPFSKAFVDAHPCVARLNEPAPTGCRPPNCTEICPDVLCAGESGPICIDGTCQGVMSPGGYVCESQRAVCPMYAPTHGADCCNAPAGSQCETVCQASFFSCRYDQCLTGGTKATASCQNGTWSVETLPCPTCPIACEPGQVCVIFSGLDGDQAECMDSPCSGGLVDCDGCGRLLCEERPSAMCDRDLSGGHVAMCLIPHSSGGT